MVVAQHASEWEQVDSLTETERGAGGFGHTGKVIPKEQMTHLKATHPIFYH